MADTPAGVGTFLQLGDETVRVDRDSGPLGIVVAGPVTVGAGSLDGIAGDVSVTATSLKLDDGQDATARNVNLTRVFAASDAFEQITQATTLNAVIGLAAARFLTTDNFPVEIDGGANSHYVVDRVVDAVRLFAGAGSTVDVRSGNGEDILGAARVNVTRNPALKVEDDPARPHDPFGLTVDDGQARVFVPDVVLTLADAGAVSTRSHPAPRARAIRPRDCCSRPMRPA